MELGAVSMMLYGFRERERILDIFEAAHRPAHEPRVRPRRRGLVMDLPDDGARADPRVPRRPCRGASTSTRRCCRATRSGSSATRAWGISRPRTPSALGVTGPMLRASGVAHDLRVDEPYLGYQDYDFEVPMRTEGDCYARYQVRIQEMRESLKIVAQALDRLPGGRVMIEDPHLAWPAKLEVGPGRHRQLRGVRETHHGGVDGGPDQPLQAGDAGHPGPGRRGVPGRRVAPRRARLLRRLRTAGTGRTASRSATPRS